MVMEMVPTLEESVLTSLEWNDEEVIALNDAMYADGRFSLPIGVNKHFNMISIVKRFQASIKKRVDTAVLWDRLNESYDLARLDTVVNCPFPNDQTEFSLPENDFNQLIRDRKSQSSQEKLVDDESRDSGSGRETPPTLPIAKRGASIQSALSSNKRKSSSISETGSDGGGGNSGGRKSISSASSSGTGGPSKPKRRI